jgi:hypothetical protein
MVKNPLILGVAAGCFSGTLTALLRYRLNFEYSGLVFAISLGLFLLPWKWTSPTSRGAAWVDVASLVGLGAIAPWLTFAALVLAARMVDNWSPHPLKVGPYGLAYLIGTLAAICAWGVCLAVFLKAFTKRVEGKICVAFLSGAVAVFVAALILDGSSGGRLPFSITLVLGEEILSGLIVGMATGAGRVAHSSRPLA